MLWFSKSGTTTTSCISPRDRTPETGTVPGKRGLLVTLIHTQTHTVEDIRTVCTCTHIHSKILTIITVPETEVFVMDGGLHMGDLLWERCHI